MIIMVRYVKHRNIDNGRYEFLFVNYDYYDGNDYLAKIFKQKFNAIVGEKIDGFHYTIIPLKIDGLEYKLVWHEDDGNCIYSENQSIKVIEKLEKMLIVIMRELNRINNKRKD